MFGATCALFCEPEPVPRLPGPAAGPKGPKLCQKHGAGFIILSSHEVCPISLHIAYKFMGFGAMEVTKPYKLIGFRAIEVTKPYKLIGFGAMDVANPYKFIGFGAMDDTKPYKFIGFGDIHGPKPHEFIGFRCTALVPSPIDARAPA